MVDANTVAGVFALAMVGVCAAIVTYKLDKLGKAAKPDHPKEMPKPAEFKKASTKELH